MKPEIRGVILDRDGVINFDSPDYILTPDQWCPIPGSLEAIAALTCAHIPVAIASNQSALGRGMLDASTFRAIHEKMMEAIEHAGGRIEHVAYCPHAPEEGCACRKPKPGLVLACLQALGLRDSPMHALMIGDSLRDIEAAHRAGTSACLVRTGYGDADSILAAAKNIDPHIRSYSSLLEAVQALLDDEEVA